LNAELVVSAGTSAHRAAQAALHARCFKKPLGPGELGWRYDTNPSGTALTLVLGESGAGPDATLSASFAYGPRTAVARGVDGPQHAVFGQQGDIMTAPEIRGQGHGRRMTIAAEAAARERGWPILWGFPNRISAPIYTHLGWETIGVIRPWAHYLDASPRARVERHREGRLAAWALGWTQRRCAAARARLAGLAQASGLAVRELQRVPAETAALSRELEARHDLCFERDAGYVEWRFLRAPSKLHRVLGAFDPSGAFVGYAAVQLPRPGECVGWMSDLLAPRADAAHALWSAAIEALAAAGASVVKATAVDGSHWQRELAGNGFLPPKAANHLYVYRRVLLPEHPIVPATADASRWYLTDGDRDDETMG
jgi:GNAT superfamily N-acetyltransferase